MKTIRAWLMRLFGVFGSSRSERELSAEIESHLQLHIDDNIRAGMTPVEARRRAADRARRRRRHEGGVSRSPRPAGVRIAGARPALRHPHAASRARASRSPASSFSASASASTPRSSPWSTPSCCGRCRSPMPIASCACGTRRRNRPSRGQEVFALSPANFIDWEAQNQVFEQMAIYQRRPAHADRPGRSRMR